MDYYKVVSVILVLVCLVNNAKSENSENFSITEHLSWKCANNATCMNDIAKSVGDFLKNGRAINFGLFEITRLTTKPKFTGRSSSVLLDVLGGNAVKLPIGPMVFSIQRSVDYDNYLEISLLKKNEFEVK